MQGMRIEPVEARNAVVRPAGGTVRLADSIELPGFSMRFDRDEEIFGESESADFVYKVVSGAVRSFRVLSDGRRQITGFHLPGDVFGLELGADHRCSAEATVSSEIALVRRTALGRLAAADLAAAGQLLAMTGAELNQAREQALLLGRKSAVERVASFLLEMTARAPAERGTELPMSRSDMADYLGLTIETVSRTLTQVEREHAITLQTARRIVLHDRHALDLAA